DPYNSPLFSSTVPATTHIYTLSLHDALPISFGVQTKGGEILLPMATTTPTDALPVETPHPPQPQVAPVIDTSTAEFTLVGKAPRSEEHTSELQSPCNLVCRLLLEKKKKNKKQ